MTKKLKVLLFGLMSAFACVALTLGILFNPNVSYAKVDNTATITSNKEFYASNSDVASGVKDSGTSLVDDAEVAAQSETTYYDVGEYTFYNDDGRIVLSGYNGAGGNITLPSAEDAGGNYEIGDNAFFSALIEGVTIPDAVTSIGERAFAYAYSLASVTIQGNNLTSIGADAFLYDYSIETLVIPDSVTHIGSEAFYNCTSLTEITLPSSLETWGTENGVNNRNENGWVFGNCRNLTSITIPANVTTIPSYNFASCTSLSEVKFAEGSVLQSVGRDAFYDTALTSVSLPASVTELAWHAFSAPTLKQFYLEEGSALTTVDFQGIFASNATLESLNLANADSDKLTTFSDISAANVSGATVFLPANASESLVYVFQEAKTLVAPDKETYAAIMESPVGQSIESILYWQTQITFTVSAGEAAASLTQQKLASDSGASIKYTLTEDANGRQYAWQIDENYAFPTRVGSFAIGANVWQDSTGSDVTLDAVITDDGISYAVVGANQIMIVEPADARMEYSGGAYEFSDNNYVLLDIKGANGQSVDLDAVIDVGTYTFYVQPANGCEWLSGGNGQKTFTLEIYKKEVLLTWYYNTLTEIGNGNDIYEIDYFVNLRAGLFSAKYEDVLITTGNGLSAVKYGDATGVQQSLLYAGLFRLTATHKNYSFTNDTLYVRVNPIVVDLSEIVDSARDVLKVGGDEFVFVSGMLYIYSDGDHMIPSFTPLGSEYTLVEVVSSDAIARYKNAELIYDISIPEALRAGYTVVQDESNKRRDIGIQQTVFKLIADSNYEFVFYGNQRADFVASVSSDKQTATITKTWYVAQLDNEFLVADAKKENDVYMIGDWTYGDDKEFTLPRLMHGDESSTWESDDRYVSFTLRMDGVADAIATGKGRSELPIYLNKYMPAGQYTLVLDVLNFECSEHRNWWNNALTEATSYPKFSRTYRFEVKKADITIDADKLPKDAITGYKNYEWQLTEHANKELFFEQFSDAIRVAGVLQTVVMTAPANTYWGTEAGQSYFGTYEISYNFARMNSESYYGADNNKLYNYIDGGANGTYTVYFQIKMPNHRDLTDVGDEGRYAYFFTVTVFETIGLPTVNDVYYTGSKVLPTVAESNLYETVWAEPTVDAYINGGEHSVTFVLYDSVHYRWENVEGDSATVNFNILAVDNDWTQYPSVIAWEFGSFDADRNVFIAVPKFIDAGQVVHFAIATDESGNNLVEGLENMTATNGVIDPVFRDKLNKLPANASGEVYYLIVSVEATANYNENVATVRFAVSKGFNSWSITPNVMQWKFGSYDVNVNLILGEAKIDDEDNPVVFKVTSDKEGKVEIIESFSLENGLVPEAVANKLGALEMGSYYLWASVAETDSYSELKADEGFEFVVSKATNGWKTVPNAIGWTYGSYDKATNLILGEAINGTVTFSVSKDGHGIPGLESFASVTDAVANVLAKLEQGSYLVTATVKVDDNYEAVDIGMATLTVAKAVNAWTVTPSIASWVKGQYDAEENAAVAADFFGSIINYEIYESANPEKIVYKVVNGEVVIDDLANAEVGYYTLKATVNDTANFGELERTFTFQIFAPEGLAWWVWLLIIAGILGVIASIFWILHEKGVLQMLTGKIIIAMRNKMTVDATIAAVRANKRAEESKKSIAKAEALDKREAERKAREEEKAPKRTASAAKRSEQKIEANKSNVNDVSETSKAPSADSGEAASGTDKE